MRRFGHLTSFIQSSWERGARVKQQPPENEGAFASSGRLPGALRYLGRIRDRECAPVKQSRSSDVLDIVGVLAWILHQDETEKECAGDVSRNHVPSKVKVCFVGNEGKSKEIVDLRNNEGRSEGPVFPKLD